MCAGQASRARRRRPDGASRLPLLPDARPQTHALMGAGYRRIRTERTLYVQMTARFLKETMSSAWG